MLHDSSLGINNIWIHSDSQELIQAINGNRRSPELFEVLSDIASLSLSFTFCRFTFILRLDNGSADYLAKTTFSLGLVGPSM